VFDVRQGKKAEKEKIYGVEWQQAGEKVVWENTLPQGTNFPSRRDPKEKISLHRTHLQIVDRHAIRQKGERSRAKHEPKIPATKAGLVRRECRDKDNNTIGEEI